MPKSIAVFGAGPGLGQAVAHRYAQGGYEVVLVARRRQPLDSWAEDVAGGGANAHVIAADLSDTDAPARCLNRCCGGVAGIPIELHAP